LPQPGGWLLRLLIPGRSPERQARSTQTQFISEEEMLALFPPGSCVVAEVNGQKELVFFDAIKAREGFMATR